MSRESNVKSVQECGLRERGSTNVVDFSPELIEVDTVPSVQESNYELEILVCGGYM